MIFLASYSILCMSITSFFLLLPYSEAYYFQWESRGSEWFKCLPPFRLLCFCPWEQIEKVVDQHIQQQREKEASGRVGGPVLKRCLGGRDLSASVILPLRESPDLLPACCPSQHACLSPSHTLVVLWITDVLKNSHFDACTVVRKRHSQIPLLP